MVSLEAGEYESVVLERGGQFRRGLGIDGRIDGAVKRVVRLLDERSHGGVGKHIRGEAATSEDLAHGAVEHIAVELHTSDTPGECKHLRLVKGG